MNKSEIFKAAHKLAKTFIGSYVACFALALKSVYKSIKEKVMKTAAELLAEITKIQARDKQYNALANEGGEGYEVDSVPQSLWAAFYAADEREFKAKWGCETFRATQKAAWNAAVNKFKALKGDALVRAVESATGISFVEMKRAKAMFG